MSDNDFADLAQFKLAHVSAATIGNHVDETFRYEAIDRFARRCATELEGLDEQRLINPTSGLQIQADDPRADQVHSCIRLRNARRIRTLLDRLSGSTHVYVWLVHLEVD